MKIDIQNTLVDLDPTVEADIQRRLLLALSKVKSHISSITFILSNVISGTGHHCSLTITLKRLPDILVEETQRDLNSAIDRTIQKATHIISRKIST
ncbi:MAG: HPF/RaiA family ribosome-associated protein [Colwellia sp.]|nr:HPF/RaiA family ribosome-associated protein [Colwellia sp.]